ncbi:SDR family NAD(P)-dependent oxidoreductase [Streptomyces sp. DSM 42041]|uniref:SDR family NAD(P)-dependent oxidoreductase n=1 Tax=Streptomyces hazeniae TaxID=3075538 RepID=A0ABU2NN94_9ACTN|nr:SDR family NAD(P)-dependent oxidoreductase [Streptomyces sp. DSM 42041]MDT0378446.1 SDR family NAD(P)-dependent oxidoreductase [Streptomyces sp. DSM 42041]
MDTIKRLRGELAEARNEGGGPLAVVGAGLRLPGGIVDLDGYWKALAEGRDLVRPMPRHRKEPFAAEWEALPHRGGFLDEVLDFDADFFGISPREARSLDPQHRLLLEVAWEALEDAGLPPKALAEGGGRTGLYVGVTGQDYRDWQAAGEENAYWLTGNGHCFAAGRLAYTMGLEGPAIAVDTACSSSLTAVHLAAQGLRRGECDVALAGGVNLILSPRSTRLIQQTNSLSPDGLCKAFDARANGFTRGEGCGVVALKRLADAVRDGDRIHAVLRGSALNQDGRSSGFTAPNVRAQIALIRAALEDAGLGPEHIGALEAHGTGTALGDPIEVQALVTALDRASGGDGPAGRPLFVGSVKTALGHLEAASGIAGLLRGLLSVQRGAVPPVVHLDTLNPRIELDGTGVEMPREVRAWQPDGSGIAACVGVSSFGMSGTNAHVILGPLTEEEAAGAPGAEPAAGAVAGFDLSARSEDALRAWAGGLADRLDGMPDEEYPAFAYTVTRGRARHAVRAAVSAPGREQAVTALRRLAEGTTPDTVTLLDARQDTEPPVQPAGTGQALERRVVSLPAYPWERKRYAPAGTAEAAGTSGRAAGRPEEQDAAPDDAAGLPLLRTVWEDAAPAQPAELPLVLVGDDLPTVTLLAEAARAQGRATTVHTAPPEDDDGWSRLWAQLPAPCRLLLVPAAGALPEQVSHEAPTDAAARLCTTVTTAVRTAPENAGHIRVLTAGVCRVTGDEAPVQGLHGALHGLAPVLGLEFPHVWGGVLDLPGRPGPDDAAAAVDGGDAAEDVLAVRDGRLHHARLRPWDARPDRPEMHADATYLLTGGLGAVGRELARDLVRRGARHLLLVGRRPRSALAGPATALLEELDAAGAQVAYAAADCGDGPQLAEALRVLHEMPPVRGVVHAAGSIARTPLAEAATGDFADALHGKFSGAWWLHLLSRDWPLDFFVNVSSVSAVWGTEGYGAYAAANGGLDATAAIRTATGLPTVSIAFGPWDLDGMADAETRATLARMGVSPVRPGEGCAALTGSGPAGGAHLVACRLDADRFTTVMNAVRPRPLLGTLTTGGADEAGPEGKTDGSAADGPGEGEHAARRAVLAAPEHRRPVVAAEHAGRILAEILGYDDPAALPGETGFLDLGLDSIMAVDAAHDLGVAFGVDVGIGDVFGHPSLLRLAAHLTERLSDSGPDAGSASQSAPAVSAAPATRAAARRTTPGTPAGVSRRENTARPVPETEPIAVVGMAGRFPGADSVEEFWSLLDEGRDGVGSVPADRWDGAALLDPTGARPGSISTDQGGFLGDIRRFDAAFFDIPAREAESLDPQQRLLMEAAWHALEDAATDPRSLAGDRTGVFVGISNSDYARVLEAGGLRPLDAYFATGTALNAAAGRIAYHLGTRGPALAVDTACSSSLVALHLAIRSLRTGESDRALAGGVNVISAPSASVAVSRAHMLSADGRCKTFDASADGFVRAEGCGVLVLRRLSDAEREGDRVLAVLHGSAVNQDGASSGFTAPDGTAQREVIRAALADAGVDAAQVGYLETHGTGTSLGDPIEVQAAWDVFGQGRRPGEPLLLGSVKSNIGHCESASGMASVFKTVLALRHGRVPANLHYSEPNPHVAWRDMNVRVVDTAVPWRRGETPRYAGVSGFGFSGTNAHLVVGEAPARDDESATAPPAGGAAPAGGDGPPPEPLLLPLSAPDAAGLQRLTAAWERALESAPEEQVPALVSTAGAGRAHFPVRRAVSGRNRDDLLTALRGEQDPGEVRRSAPRIAFLFSGQGAQYFGMGRGLYETEPVFAEVFDDCDRILEPHLGDSLLNLVLYGDDPALIGRTRFTQPALVALELSLAALWESWGVRAAAVTGHSVGEIAAAVHAGVLSREDGLTLVAHRARLMQSTAPGGMLSVPLDPDVVTARAAEAGLDVAAVNGPQSVVVAGDSERLEAFSAQLGKEGVRCRSLVVSHAFHSRLMDPVLDEFEETLTGLRFAAPRLPLVSNVTGTEAGPDTYDAAYFARHIRRPVQFLDGARELRRIGADVLLEIGPDRTLVNLVRAAGLAPAGGGVPSLRRGAADRAVLLAAAGTLYGQGQQLDWGRVTGRRAGPGDAPRYPFADTEFWTGTVPAGGVRGDTHGPDGRPSGQHHGRHWGAELRSPGLKGRAFGFTRSASFPPYLGDHRLYGTVVTPAASHLATVLSALGGDGGPVVVDDLICPRALVIKDGEEYETQIVVGEPAADGTRDLSVQSLLDARNGVWQKHVGGRWATPGPAAVRRPSVVDHQEFVAGSERRLSREEFYSYFHELGYTLGPSFRWIEEAWIRGDEALVRYTAPPLPDDPADYELYPGLIDSCFQSMAVFLVDDDATEAASLAIPFAAARLSFHSRPVEGRELWGHVRVLRSEPLPRGRLRVETADLHLYAWDSATADAHSIFRADEFRIRHASRTVLESSLRGDDLVYETAWEPLPAATTAAGADRTALRVALLEQPEAAGGKALEEALTAAGHTVSLHSGVTAAVHTAELVVDTRWLTPAGTDTGPDAGDALHAVLQAADALRALPHGVRYVLPVDGSATSAPLREALFGLLTALEAEHPDRRLVRLRLDDGPGAEQLADVLGRLPDDTRLALTVDGLRTERLVPVPAGAQPDGPDAPPAGSALVTGGLGALGLAVATAHAARGGDRITLMGRSAPGGTEQAVLDELASSGVRVTVVQGDVTDPDDCAAAVAAATADGPLHTVYHLAGTNADAAFESLTEASFEKVFHAKSGGADVLVEALAEHTPRSVVLFSSVSALLGSAGQTNYAAANGYLDGLAQRLRARGVPATSVNWGPWVPEVKGGMAASAAVERAAERLGVRALCDADAAAPLALAAAGVRPRLAVVALDAARYARQAAGHPRAALVSALAGPAPGQTSGNVPVADTAAKAGWLAERLRTRDAEDLEPALREAVRDEVARMLGSADPLPPDGSNDGEGFAVLGLDSIMAIDLRASLAHAVGTDLPATVAIDHPSVLAMSGFLQGYVGATAEPAGVPAAPVPQATTPHRVTPHTPQAEPSFEDLSLDELLQAVQDDLSQER